MLRIKCKMGILAPRGFNLPTPCTPADYKRALLIVKTRSCPLCTSISSRASKKSDILQFRPSYHRVVRQTLFLPRCKKSIPEEFIYIDPLEVG
jgi:hypothetical protein